MEPDTDPTADPLADPQLLRAVADYQAEAEAGRRPDAEALLARYPAAEGLAGCLRMIDFVRAAAPCSIPPHAPRAALSSGVRLGDFRILREVGRGGMGVVYEAEQISLGRRVALKVLPSTATADERALQRFRNEAHAAAALQHAHIVPVHAVGLEGDAHFFAMQFIEGETLATLVRQLRAPSSTGVATPADPDADTDPKRAPTSASVPAEGEPARLPAPGTPAYFRAVARLIAQAAEALQHAHDCGVIHRDIKPGNLMLDQNGELWVTDFGLARLPGSDVTGTGDLVGTLRYMSPEQAAGRPIDHRVDIYALGITLYELLTLHPAFPDSDRQVLLRRIVDDDPPPPRRVEPAVPRDLEIVVLTAMAKESHERYATAQEFADDLERFLEGRPILARPAGRLQRSAKWVRRNPVTAALLATIVLTLLVGLAGTSWKWREADTERTAAQRASEVADEEREEAERSFQDAFRAVNDYFTRVSEHRLLDEPGLQPLRKELLEDALRFYQQFIDRRGQDPKLRLAVALTYRRIGQINYMIDAKPRSLEAFQNALPILETLMRHDPGHVEVRLACSECYHGIGQLRAESGQLVEALRQFEQARDIQEGLVHDHPAKRDFRRHLAWTWLNVGTLHFRTGKAGESRQAHRQALSLLSRLVEDQPQDPNAQSELAKAYSNIGLLDNRPGQYASALDFLERARTISQQIVDEHPHVGHYRWSLAATYNHIGAVQRNAGRREEALDACRKASVIYGRLVNENPTVRQYQYGLSGSYGSLGILHYMARQLDEAKESFERERKILENLTGSYAEHLEYHSALAASWSNLGLTLGRLGKHKEAQTAYEAAITSQRKAFDAAPQIVKHRDFLNKQYRNLARCLGELKRPADAVAATLERRKLWPNDPIRLYEVACDLAQWANQQSSAERERTAGLAVETLRQAAAGGFKDSAKLRTDATLAPLRDRDDFRQFVQTLK